MPPALAAFFPALVGGAGLATGSTLASRAFERHKRNPPDQRRNILVALGSVMTLGLLSLIGYSQPRSIAMIHIECECKICADEIYV